MYEKFKDRMLALLSAILLTAVLYSLAYLLSAKVTIIDLKYLGATFILSCVWMYFLYVYRGYRSKVICLLGIFTVLGLIVPCIGYLTDPLILQVLMKDLLVYATLPLCILSIPLIIENFRIRKICLWLFTAVVGILTIPIIVITGYYYSGHAKLAADELVTILQTSYQEAGEFLSSYFSIGDFILFIILYCAILAVIYILLKKIFVNFRAEKFTRKPQTLLLLILMCSGLMFLWWGTYVIGTAKSAVRTLKEAEVFQTNRAAKLVNCNGHEENYSFALVIGESETRTHMSVYGYKRDTTPRLAKQEENGEAILIKNGFSCAANTSRTLEMALTEKSQYNDIPLKDAITIIEMARHAGYRTVWLDNQDSHTLASFIAWQADKTIWLNENRNARGYYKNKRGFFDNIAVQKLNEMGKSQQKTLYIIHLFGSHNIYSYRYPENFNIWDESNKVNAYDNSILYTDYIMSELYNVLFNRLDVAGMIYFSDHGEELTKYFNHGPEFFMNNYKKLPSTWDIVKIPVYMRFSEKYKEARPETAENLERNKEKYFSNDMIYDTLLGIMNIKCQHYNYVQDISDGRYNFSKNTLRTMYGKVKIKEVN